MLVAFLAASSAGAAPAAASAATPDVEPPACDDPRVIWNVTRSYADAILNAPRPPLVRVLPPREVALVSHVDALDTPTARVMFHGYPWGHSRYCKATLELAGHATDTAHWRIDARKRGPEDQFQLSPCFDAWMRKLSDGHQDCSFLSP